MPICADPSYADKAQKGSTRRAHESTAGVDGFAAVRSYSPIPRPGVAPPAGPRPVFVCSSHVETLAPYAGVVAGTLRRPFAQVELPVADGSRGAGPVQRHLEVVAGGELADVAEEGGGAVVGPTQAEVLVKPLRVDLPAVTNQRVALSGEALRNGQYCGAALPSICTGLPATPVLAWDPVPGAASTQMGAAMRFLHFR